MAKKTRLIAAVVAIFLVGTISGFIITAQLRISNLNGDDNRVPYVEGASEEAESPFAKVAELVTPAVVNISTEKVIKFQESPFFEQGDPFEELFRKYFNIPIPSIPREYKSTSLGSGFIFNSDGDIYYILTNNHVIANASKIIVKLYDGTKVSGNDVKIIGSDKNTDVAVISIKVKKDLPLLKLGDSDKIKVGDWAIAVGNPFGLEGTVTVGVISAKGRSGIPLPDGPVYENFIQTDAAINPGNSGGPLLNIKGEAIGINTAITSPSGAYAGVGFAIPINTAKFVVDQILKKGKVIRGYVGIYPQELTPELAKTYNLDKPKGVLVAQIAKGSPAEKAGIKEGDVIIKFDGKEAADVEAFRLMVAQTPPGKIVNVELVTERGERKTVKLKVEEYPEDTAQSEKPKEDSESESDSISEATWIGMTVIDIDTAQRLRLYSGDETSGVVVRDITPGSIADFAGIMRGDLIQKIGDLEVKTIKDFNAAVKKYKDIKGPLRFKILRNGIPIYIAITIR
ncbi:MAG TPA: Do family serine endopeptidase [Candidatus Hydrothermia bacterium]|nr:Do family serine endopeptidase [Candidatus Hydrothermae bacterium]MDD3649399.1 Do family serine endopeptidase [Candidatus Hydrothermia bacterium]MDD5572529.1 Do family serine endopeptidase [Candidatus Hydrothermia bacterium]HOK22883.1 Do family serine endopeptidase [Candidatus Hydrothermia bacterium]HOL23592.1 Do family serine endopeptidase [Candidatus Hydrothermia bacterium]